MNRARDGVNLRLSARWLAMENYFFANPPCPFASSQRNTAAAPDPLRQQELGDGLHTVAAGEDERWDDGGSERGGDGDTAKVDVDVTMLAAPDLGRREHASATAHVAKGSLAGTVGTAAGNTGDTGHRTAVPQDSVQVWWPARRDTA